MKTSFFLAVAGLVLLSYSSCTRDRAAMPKACASLPDTVSFSQHVIPLFEAHCSIAGCHTASALAGSLNLESDVAYAEVTKPVSGYVDTLSPDASLLYNQMISVTSPMPPTGVLDDCTTRLILKWIEQKAKNN